MKVKPKDVMITVPAVHLLANEDDDAQLAANFNTFIHGKVHLKYEFLGYLGGQRVSIFYLQRNEEFSELREEFMRLIENEQIANHQSPVFIVEAFTIGHTGSYDRLLAEGPPERCQKMGAHDDYQGGYIWKTAQEADDFIHSQAFLDLDWGDGLLRPPENFSVYKVELANGWQDVSPVPGSDGIFHLLVNSRFYK